MGTVTLPQHGASAWNFSESKSGEHVGLFWWEDNTVLLEPCYSSITVEEIYCRDWQKVIDTFYRVQADGKYGLILVEFYRLLNRTSAELVIQPTFDDLVQLDRFCFRTRIGQRYGLCCGGDEAVPPSYRGIELLTLPDDAFVIKADMNYGVLARGDWTLPLAENKQAVLNYLQQQGQTDLYDHPIFADGPACVLGEVPPPIPAPEPLATLMKPVEHHMGDVQEGTGSVAVKREPHGLEGPMPARTPELTPHHEGDREAAHRRRAGEIVSSEPSNETLLTLISWLDKAYCAASVHGELNVESSVLCQVLARAVIAAGYLLKQTKPFATIERTIHAAEVYALDPTEDHYDAFLEAATNSYPFGPGDGCFAVAETGYAGCEPGSGCHSGAGSLYQSKSGLESTAVMVVITKELLPWLNGEGDIVAKRKEGHRT